MKLASILFTVSLGAALATACGGIATVGNPLRAGDAGSSSPSEQDANPATSSGGAPSGGGADAGMPGFNVACQGAQSCPVSQICCATFSFGTGMGNIDVACATSCPAGGFQVCATSAECTTSGDVCTPSPLGAGSYCAAPRGGGPAGPTDGGTTTASAPDASVALDATVAHDAATSDGAIVDATVFDATVFDAIAIDATGGDATIPDATSADATSPDATGADATSPDATGSDAVGDDATEEGSSDDGSSDFDAVDP
jgi:hypothetical protein